jgi:hypothetical protein
MFDLGGNKMKKILLFITILLTVILVLCADLEDKAIYTVSFDTSIDVLSQIESIEVVHGNKVTPPTITSVFIFLVDKRVFIGISKF